MDQLSSGRQIQVMSLLTGLVNFTQKSCVRPATDLNVAELRFYRTKDIGIRFPYSMKAGFLSGRVGEPPAMLNPDYRGMHFVTDPGALLYSAPQCFNPYPVSISYA